MSKTAKTTGERIIVLCEGTLLVPTKEPVAITEKESTDKFTTLLVEKGEIVLGGALEKQIEKEQQRSNDDGYDHLRETLNTKTKAELEEMLTSVDIEIPSRANKDTLVELLVDHEKSI